MTTIDLALVTRLLLVCPLLWLVGCGDSAEPSRPASDQASDGPARQVVVYTSADDYLARAVFDAFELRSGIEVIDVGDTEATKTVGLYQRLLDEHTENRPAADVWWSSEPFYTVRLAEAGVLEPWTAREAESEFGGAWPTMSRAADSTWYGFGRRARVIAYDTRKIEDADVPRTLRDLAEPAWEGRVGMARPLFGTTVGHMATLVHLWGPGPTHSWLSAMEANGLRLYDSNSAVVRAIADGEIELGLTDTDDVWVAQERGWPIGAVYESDETGSAAGATPETVAPLMGFGALSIPNTVARVAGGPNAPEAGAFIEFLLSPEGERLLMGSDSRNVPVRLDLAGELAASHPGTVNPSPAEPELEAVAASIEEARRVAREVLGL
ncbi:MAG: extracellular solute-binding protein [Planctomycetota bacterium]